MLRMFSHQSIPLLLAILVLSSCNQADNGQKKPDSAQPESKQNSVLRIHNWENYIAEEVLTQFTQSTGIEIEYTTYLAGEQLDQSLNDPHIAYDLVVSTAQPFAARQLAEAKFQRLQKYQLPLLKNIDKSILKSLARIDVGNEYFVPYLWGSTGIGYNEKLLRERLGNAMVFDSWSLLFDPKIASKLQDCGIALVDDDYDNFVAAMFYAGIEPHMEGQGEIDVALETLQGMRPYIKHLHTNDFIDDLANGELCIVIGYNGDILQASMQATEQQTGADIRYLIPREGAIQWLDVMAIPANAQNPEAAHLFINFLLQPKIIAQISNAVAYANAIPLSNPFLNPEIISHEGIYPPTQVITRLVIEQGLRFKEQGVRARAWAGFKTQVNKSNTE